MISMRAFADEYVKIAGAGQLLSKAKDVLVPAVKKHWKPAALVGAGATGMLGAQRLGKDIMFAERARSQGYEF